MRPDILHHPTLPIRYNMGIDFVCDTNGNVVFPGDYVQCMTIMYDRIGHGQRGRVAQIVNGKIKLHGIRSLFDPHRFRLSGRYHPWHHNGVDKRYPREKYETTSEKKGNEMLHVAIKVLEGQNYAEMARMITEHGQGSTSMSFHDNIMSDVTLSALKERVKARIHRHPDERWLLLSGNTIAESSAPPIAFRQW